MKITLTKDEIGKMLAEVMIQKLNIKIDEYQACLLNYRINNELKNDVDISCEIEFLTNKTSE